MLGYDYHLDAEIEYDEAITYYARISEELGTGFVTQVEEAIARIRQFPEAWPRVAPHIRQCPLHRFRYRVIYRPGPDKVVIIAVAHTSRRPGYWKDRL